MPQRCYFNENDLDSEFEKLDALPYQLVDFAFIHEEVTNNIETLMGRWFIERNDPIYQNILNEFENDEDKDDYDDIDEYIFSNYGSRWWIESFSSDLDDDIKLSILWRYRNTIHACIYSDTYNSDSIWDEIEDM